MDAAPAPPELAMVARAVERLVARNDALELAVEDGGGGGDDAGMAAFEAASGAGGPRIAVAQYLERVHRYAGLEPECYVAAYAYLDMAAHRRPAAAVASRNVHRLLLACLLVASKVLDDFHHNNAFFARVGGVSNGEMNKLELELLAVLDFEVMLSRRVYDHYHAHLGRETRHTRDGVDDGEVEDDAAASRHPAAVDEEEDGGRRVPNGTAHDHWSQLGGKPNGGARRRSPPPTTSRYSFSG